MAVYVLNVTFLIRPIRKFLLWLIKLIDKMLGCHHRSLQLVFTVDGISITGDNLMARMTKEQTIDVSIVPLTAAGNPATIEGDARFSANPATAGSFVQLTPLSVTFTPDPALDVTVPVPVQILVEADADLDVGEERLITASGVLEITSPEAHTLEVVFGTPMP